MNARLKLSINEPSGTILLPYYLMGGQQGGNGPNLPLANILVVRDAPGAEARILYRRPYLSWRGPEIEG